MVGWSLTINKIRQTVFQHRPAELFVVSIVDLDDSEYDVS